MADELWMDAEIIKIEDETPTTRRFWFRLNELESFRFSPGQFVSLELPIHEKKSKRIRSYSIASAPGNTNVFELVIVLVEDGMATPYMWSNFKLGGKIPCRGPLGHFTLPDHLDRDLCLVCTGTGIAPFRSMVHYIHQNQIPCKNVYLIFGCRTREDILYRDELMQLAAEMPSFHYYYVCSREDPQSFEGHTGYVHAVYEQLFSDKRPVHFYLCGWRNMLNEARTRIQAMGYDKSSIHVEIYG
jgi:CDP-4-dehydro-6-deoxyglucose reductase